eukprot:COSAG05_NODE_5478_length_1163_cov_0.963346_2_plen_127_part_00
MEADGERTPPREQQGTGGQDDGAPTPQAQQQLQPRFLTGGRWRSRDSGGCERLAVLVSSVALLLFLIAAMAEAAFTDNSTCDLELPSQEQPGREGGGARPITAEEVVENSPSRLTLRCGFFVAISL